jgi:murein L,D-transpeptidase YcbB/YkuD
MYGLPGHLTEYISTAKRILFVGIVVCAAPHPAAAQSTPEELLRQQLEYGALGGELVIGGERLYTAPLMLQLYAESDFGLLWTRTEQLTEFEQIALRLELEGLDPDDLPLQALRQTDADTRDPADIVALVERDLLATEVLIRATFLLVFGKVDPQTLDNDWNFKRPLESGDGSTDFIRAAIAADDVSEFLATEIDRGPVYRQTMHALATFRQLELAGGWPTISAGATLREGDSDTRVLELRARLRMTGQLASADDTGTKLFDTELADAVQRFQQQHGLAEDGAVGKDTLAALNVPAATRVDQLRMALERLRWVLGEFEADMLFVNIAGFRAYLMQDGVVTWDGRVMVGQPFRKTPIFRGDMEYLVFNPTWTVPPSILAEDTLPAIQQDPGYLARNNIIVLTFDGAPVDPATIDWQAMSAQGFPYILRQLPGPQNAMGQVKFIFPNEHFIFLHDTPDKNLFDRPERAFSSGCIRVEHPLELAQLLLDDTDNWSRAAIDAMLTKKQTRSIHLRETVPIFLMYITASAEPDGTTRFYRDIYERDARLLQELMGDTVIDAPGQ